MEIPIRNYHGFVDKFIGDAIMALFEHNPQNAVSAALDMFSELKRFNIELINENRPPIQIGIGINTGKVMIGVVGSENRTDTTVLGDAVNTASRIESLTKYYGCSFLTTDEAYQHLTGMKHLLIRYIDSVLVKGRKTATKLYEIFNKDTDDVQYRKKKFQRSFEEACHVYQSGDWKSAEKLFDEYLKKVPEDSVAARIRDRCVLFMKIPPKNWNGVFKFSDK